MTNEPNRLPLWKRNDRLENLLSAFEEYLGDTPLAELHNETPNVLFVCGVGRSGTSLLLQYLAASGMFAYPSNFISRFYKAPYIGEMAQCMLLNESFDHGDQFADLRSGIKPISFASQLGKSDSTLEPNEFWYFWRRFFDFETGTRYAANNLNNEAGKRFRLELSHWERAAGKPLVMKAVTASWNIAGLAKLLPNARFLIMRRDPVDHMISLLNARFRFWGNIGDWYGLVLPQDIGISPSSPYEQVALQVAAFDVLLPVQTQQISGPCCHNLDYEKFCISPDKLWNHEIMAPYKQGLEQLAAQSDEGYQSLRFEPRRALPDEHSPHHDVSRAALLALYEKYVHELEKLS